jgi:hypothetical protein
LSLIVPEWLFKERPQTIRVLPADMGEVEAMLQLGGQALLDAAEFVLLKNMLRRLIKPLRRAVAVFRRILLRHCDVAQPVPPRPGHPAAIAAEADGCRPVTGKMGEGRARFLALNLARRCG